MLANQRFLFLLFTSFLFVYRADAQMGVSDSSLPYLAQQYNSLQGANLLLYNGAEYAHSYPHTTGHPFFLTDTFQSGSVVYDGVLYQNVPLAYDLVSNAVVIKNKDNFLIELKPEKISSFGLQHHFFVALSRSKIKNNSIEPGIYEAYNYGTIAVFIMHQKIIKQAANAADPDNFVSYDYYFIKKNEDYVSIKNSNELLSVFSDKSNDIKAYLHQHHLNFKKTPENTLLQAAAYYAQLKK